MLRVLIDDAARADIGLDEIVREGARRMLAMALEAEADAYIDRYAVERGDDGRRLVVRNGHAKARSITTSAGAVEVEAPRVDDKGVDDTTGQRRRFKSSIIPPWCRKSPKVAEVLPLMYLHGMSTGDFVPALSELFLSSAGLSASVITRLTRQWQEELAAFATRRLDDVDYVYVFDQGRIEGSGGQPVCPRLGCQIAAPEKPQSSTPQSVRASLPENGGACHRPSSGSWRSRDQRIGT